jgi:hypothetical protein
MPRDLKSPFKFNVNDVVERLRKLPVSVDGITITLPFAEIKVSVDKVERTVAREVVIRLADRRVLNSEECCDGCIRDALASLQEIRKIVLDKQVELSDKTDGTLYILLDTVREAIRQFLTFEQRLDQYHQAEARELYFAGLEAIRAHILRTLIQIAKIAALDTRNVPSLMTHQENWPLKDYRKPALPKSSKDNLNPL